MTADSATEADNIYVHIESDSGRLQIDGQVSERGWLNWQTMEEQVRVLLDEAEQHLRPLHAGHIVGVHFCNDAEQRALNNQFRAQDKATNVLSFPSGLTEAFPGEALELGDISIALETVDREARAAGIAFADHARHMILHGLLHLAGHDHKSDADAALMEGLETSILGKIGVRDPYSVDDVV